VNLYHCKACGAPRGRTDVYCGPCLRVRIVWRDVLLTALWIAAPIAAYALLR